MKVEIKGHRRRPIKRPRGRGTPSPFSPHFHTRLTSIFPFILPVLSIHSLQSASFPFVFFSSSELILLSLSHLTRSVIRESQEDAEAQEISPPKKKSKQSDSSAQPASSPSFSVSQKSYPTVDLSGHPYLKPLSLAWQAAIAPRLMKIVLHSFPMISLSFSSPKFSNSHFLVPSHFLQLLNFKIPSFRYSSHYHATIGWYRRALWNRFEGEMGDL